GCWLSIFRPARTRSRNFPICCCINSALFKRHGLRVRSLLVLLPRGADSRQLTGLYERGFADEPFDVALRYRCVRVWQLPAEMWLSGGLGLLAAGAAGGCAAGEA